MAFRIAKARPREAILCIQHVCMQNAQHAYAAAQAELKAAVEKARSDGRQAHADDLELLLYERQRSERHVVPDHFDYTPVPPLP